MSAPSIKPATRVSTTVLTYILNPNVNLGRFLTTIKEKLPKAVVTVRTDDKGYQNVSVTTTIANPVIPDSSIAQGAAYGAAAAAGVAVVGVAVVSVLAAF